MKRCGTRYPASWRKALVTSGLLCCAASTAALPEGPANGVGAEPYTQALIVSPANDSAVRSNAGRLTVRARVDPPLREGHRLQLLLDGVPLGVEGQTSTFELDNIDRGTHSLQLQVIDDAGRVLFTGTPSKFHLLRHSRLHRRRKPSN